MSEPPALATATLAQLYMQQGHLEQARRVLARVLAADPFHAHAHALAARLAERSRARLYAAFQRSSIVVRWHDAPAGPDLHLLLAIFLPVPRAPGRACVHVTSVRCSTPAGEHSFSFSSLGAHASASLCLARLRLPAAATAPAHSPADAPPALQILAVHEAISWPPAGP